MNGYGGKGVFHVDGEEFAIREGSMIRVAPEGKRAIKAGDETLIISVYKRKMEV